MVTRVLAASAAVAFVMVFAAPAQADADADAKFIHGLDFGQIPYEDPDFAVLLGHIVCMRLSGATGTYPTTFDYVRGAHPAWTDSQNGYFIALAVTAYCPNQETELPLSP